MFFFFQKQKPSLIGAQTQSACFAVRLSNLALRDANFLLVDLMGIVRNETKSCSLNDYIVLKTTTATTTEVI